jgi:hypothetical protein
MADDAPMSTKRDDKNATFGEVAREELSVTARAFFAPVVGAVHVVRALLHETASAPKDKPPAKDAA